MLSFHHLPSRLLLALLLLTAMFLNGCAGQNSQSINPQRLYLTEPVSDDSNWSGPAFLIDRSDLPHNRIGNPSLGWNEECKQQAWVDPSKAVAYHESQRFSTERGNYLNQVYRLHFSEVPFSLIPFHITTGKNSGLLVIYTFNDADELLLITTLHTCGCYLAFIPTTAMPPEALPQDWPQDDQWVYGHTLPALTPQAQADKGERLIFTLAAGTHRIRDVHLADRNWLDRWQSTRLPLAPLAALYTLPFNGGTDSFFEMEGPREGYVKDASKPLERLLISWWAFDLRIGEDKAFGGGDTSPLPLYTSIKFWAREASDIKDFPRFLQYWGWGL